MLFSITKSLFEGVEATTDIKAKIAVKNVKMNILFHVNFNCPITKPHNVTKYAIKRYTKPK